MRSKVSDEIFEKLAKKYGVSKGDIESMVESPFKLVRERIPKDSVKSEGIFPSIRIPFWGIFYVPDYKIKTMIRRGIIKKK